MKEKKEKNTEKIKKSFDFSIILLSFFISYYIYYIIV